MPPLVPDSDDDGEDIAFESDDEKPLLAPDATDGPGNLDGTTEQSTGSTERLRKQIRDAERNLFGPSERQAATMSASHLPGSSTSPTITQARKRGQSAIDDTARSMSPSQENKRLKRTKTASVTYSKKGRLTSQPQDNDDGSLTVGPKTSQSARFTEHSQTASSLALPQPSLQADFAAHEPNVMFRDSGSTIPENESSHQRQVDEALAYRKGLVTSTTKLASEEEEPKSSSIFWSASERTPSTVKNAVDGDDVDGGMVPASRFVGDTSSQHVETEAIEVGQQLETARPHASPRVEIGPPSGSPVLIDTGPDTSTEKSKKGRKRRSHEESSQPVTSDDLMAMGLPKEQYQPRPSRRRATQMVDEPIDYGVIPEKAIRAKRRKTVDGSAVVPVTKNDAADEPSQIAATEANGKTQQGRPEVVEEHPFEPACQTSDTAQQIIKPPSSKVDDANAFVKPSPSQRSARRTIKQPEDESIFVKPSPKPMSSSKASRRSHTTIFEDHVDHEISERRPTLSQQQAKRKATLLKDVPNPAAGKRSQKSKRKVVDSDDEDGEEDELALDVSEAKKADEHDSDHEVDDDDEIVIAPKKRGRKRSTKEAKTAEPTVASVEDELEIAVEQQPPKKKPGRPRKASAPAQAALEAEMDEAEVHKTLERDDHATATITNAEPDTANQRAPTFSPLTPPRATTTSERRPSQQQAPTPSPEKQPPSEKPAVALVSTPPEAVAKTGPTLHSPLKSTSAVPLRVGLSKRQRIAPLLRVMRPPIAAAVPTTKGKKKAAKGAEDGKVTAEE